MKILYVSQIYPPDDPVWAVEGPEAPQIEPVFKELGVSLRVVDATVQELPEPACYDGVIVGGSVGSANDRELWRGILEDWLRQDRDRPILGICGGHQLLARALGGRVEARPPRQIGVFPLDLDGVPGFAGQVMQAHSEWVVKPPRGARIWGTDQGGIQALRYPGLRWTVQFHPEFTRHRALRVWNRMDPGGRWGEEKLGLAVRSGRSLLAAWLAKIP